MTRWPYHLLINLFSSWTYLGFQPCNSRWLWVKSSNCAEEQTLLFSPNELFQVSRVFQVMVFWERANKSSFTLSTPFIFYRHFVVSLPKASLSAGEILNPFNLLLLSYWSCLSLDVSQLCSDFLELQRPELIQVTHKHKWWPKSEF